MRRTRMHLISIAFSVLLGITAASEGPNAALREKSPVYFPILPEDFKDFGIKLGGGGLGSDTKRTGKKLDMPVTTAKPTTTTDKLPINLDGILSHVALEAITEPPGPSYLTDSYYYLDDHTKAPGSGEHSSEEHGHGVIPFPLDRESESHGAQALQNLAPIRDESFGERKPSALAFSAPDDLDDHEVPNVPVRPSNRVPARFTTPAPPPSPPPPSPTHTSAPVPSTTPSPAPESSSTSHPDKNMKLRPAFTPIPTPAPIHIRTPTTRAPSRVVSRPSTRPQSRTTSRAPAISTRPPTTEASARAPTRVPKFESARISKTQPSRRPTSAPKTSYRTPTPPTITTTPTPASTTTTAPRGYGERALAGSAPRRQYLSAVTTSPGESPVYRTSTKSYRAPSSLYHIRGATTTVTAPSQPDFVQTDANIYVPLEYDEEAIPGEAGVDYPNYRSVPETSFSCVAQEHPGLYADTEAQCQTFHICQEDGRQDSFLCPNGTVFNQQYFVCDWWYNFSCDHADRFYSLNAFIYELPESTKYSRK